MFKFNSQGIPDNVPSPCMQLAISQEISDVWRTSSATAYVETISSITDLVLTEIHSWNTDLFYTGVSHCVA